MEKEKYICSLPVALKRLRQFVSLSTSNFNLKNNKIKQQLIPYTTDN